MSSHFFVKALRDIIKNSREFLFNVNPLTTTKLSLFQITKMTGHWAE